MKLHYIRRTKASMRFLSIGVASLSNNQLVCALLLLVSLLTACSGTTGGGNTEVSMQSNSSSTNTISVPTAKAHNPSLSAGNTVRVARWSRDPKGLIMSATIYLNSSVSP